MKKAKRGEEKEARQKSGWQDIPLRVKQEILTFVPLKDMMQVLLSGNLLLLSGPEKESKEKRIAPERLRQLFFQYSHFVFHGSVEEIQKEFSLLERQLNERSHMLQRIEIVTDQDYDLEEEEEEEREQEDEEKMLVLMGDKLFPAISTLINLQILHLDALVPDDHDFLVMLPNQHLKQVVLHFIGIETAKNSLLCLFGSIVEGKFGQKYEQLTYVDLTNCGIAPRDHFEQWLSNVPALETLILTHVNWFQPGVLLAVGKNCHSLKRLSLNSFSKVQEHLPELEDELEFLFKQCKGLELLQLELSMWLKWKWQQVDVKENLWDFEYKNTEATQISSILPLRLWLIGGQERWNEFNILQPKHPNVAINWINTIKALQEDKKVVSVLRRLTFGEDAYFGVAPTLNLLNAFPTLVQVAHQDYYGIIKTSVTLDREKKTFKLVGGDPKDAVIAIRDMFKETKYACQSLLFPRKEDQKYIQKWEEAQEIMDAIDSSQGRLEQIELSMHWSESKQSPRIQESILKSFSEKHRGTLQYLSFGDYSVLSVTPTTMQLLFETTFPRLDSVDLGFHWDGSIWSIQTILKNFKGMKEFRLGGLLFMKETVNEFPKILMEFCARNSELKKLSLGGVTWPWADDWPSSGPNFPFHLPLVEDLRFNSPSNTILFDDLFWIWQRCPKLRHVRIGEYPDSGIRTPYGKISGERRREATSKMLPVRGDRKYPPGWTVDPWLAVSKEMFETFPKLFPREKKEGLLFDFEKVAKAIPSFSKEGLIEKKATRSGTTATIESSFKPDEDESFQKNMNKISEKVIQESTQEFMSRSRLLSQEEQQLAFELANFSPKKKDFLSLFDGSLQLSGHDVWLSSDFFDDLRIRKRLFKLGLTPQFN
jgi:hypothetical protein